MAGTGSHDLIRQASYGPDDLKILGQAFDEAWQTVAPTLRDDQLAREALRLKLAEAILMAAHVDCRDIQTLKNAALAAWASNGTGATS
jgi:hypothetical protein